MQRIRSSSRIIYFVVLVFLVLSACAAPQTATPKPSAFAVEEERRLQEEMVLTQRIKESARVDAVFWPIQAANVPLCDTTAFGLGLTLWNAKSFKADDRDMAADSLNVGDAVRVKEVYPTSSAAKAGIKAGDILSHINGQILPKENKKALEAAMKAIHSPTSVELRFNRDRAAYTVTLTPIRVCAYPVVYEWKKNEVDAYTNGKKIYISRGMLRFAVKDEELALVLAHEMAHNVMDHRDKKTQNAGLGILGGLAVDVAAAASGLNTRGTFTDLGLNMGALNYSVDFEKEADYVGMYILSRAGYDTAHVADFWRRLAVEYDMSSIKSRVTHPTTSERFLAIDATQAEITRKKAAGEPLMPEMKKK